jgi:hypothetical protein
MSGLLDEMKHKSKRDGGAIAHSVLCVTLFRSAWTGSTLTATVIRCRNSVLPSQRTLASSTDTFTETLAPEGSFAAQSSTFCRQVAVRPREGSEICIRFVQGSISSRSVVCCRFPPVRRRRVAIDERPSRAALRSADQHASSVGMPSFSATSTAASVAVGSCVTVCSG